MTPQQFIAKWQKVTLSERSACQQHFLDLCELLDQPKPAEADPEGTWYTFERGVEKVAGGKGAGRPSQRVAQSAGVDENQGLGVPRLGRWVVARYVVEPDGLGVGTVRWPRTVPKDPHCAESLKKRTLTNLYNKDLCGA